MKKFGGCSVELEVGRDGVAVITLCNPPLNELTAPLLWALKQRYEEALSRLDVAAIVLTGDGGRFSSGFDVITMEEIQRQGTQSLVSWLLLDLQNLIEGAKKPSVAAIQGIAFGSGLELALCCHARITTSGAEFGLPELHFGILHGVGGIQRLLRLMGITKAVDVMLLSKQVSSEEAKVLGLVDAIVSEHDELLETARKWALDIAYGGKPWIITREWTGRVKSIEDAREILKFARKKIKTMAPNLRRLLVYMDIFEEAVLSRGLAGFSKEREISGESVFTAIVKALVHVFFAQRASLKIAGVTDLGLKPRSINKVGVISDGNMGPDIATIFILNKIPVVFKEVNAGLLESGLSRIKATLNEHVQKGKLTKLKYDKRFSLVDGVLDYENFRTVDMVIEATAEDHPTKQQILHDLENICHSTCILATHSSTFDITVVGKSTVSQHRIVGAHFFRPAYKIPLLEIVRTQHTAAQVLVDLLDFGKRINKVPIVVHSGPGFAINRTFYPYTQAAVLLVDLGVDLYRVDYVVTAFGMPMGPFRLADHAGYEPGLTLGDMYSEAFPERVYKTKLFSLMMEDSRYGESSGRGFYIYDHLGQAKPDTSIHTYVEKSRAYVKISSSNNPISISDEELLEMIFFPIVNEACRVLEEGIVTKASDLDIASIFGMGFPVYR
eukprot:c20679_g1_i1 orf=272-2275(+)